MKFCFEPLFKCLSFRAVHKLMSVFAEKQTSRIRLLLAALALFYVLLFGLAYLADPLGQVPVLDGRENLAWASLLRGGALPAEPIYRALLYPLVLAQFAASSLPVSASLLGLLMHLLSALLVGLIAWQLWVRRSAAYLSGLLYVVYPVALYFSGQVLDITFSIMLFLAGLYLLLRAMACESPRGRILLGLLAGALAGLAVLARPNFLPAVLCFPLVILLPKSRSWPASLSVAVGLLSLLCVQGCVNRAISGQFRILPWQGAYNLYAANREGANGRYYMQRVAFNEVRAGANTTRMESEILYRQALGVDASLEVDAMNQYWRAQLFESIRSDPARWIGLMTRKLVYVFNNWEQYNNLTYAYHKARWPVLAWNPLGWGVLLLTGFVGLFAGFLHSQRPALYAIAILALAYTAGLLLFFVSARFRLPLAPLLCVATGGCVFVGGLSCRQRLVLGLGLLALAILSFGNWSKAQDRATFIQDELLLAKASSQLGDDARALGLARAVLLRAPQRAEAKRLELSSLFNLWLSSPDSETWRLIEQSLDGIQSPDASVEFIRGVYFWREGQAEQAVRIWEAALQAYGPAAQSSADALQVVGELPVNAARVQALEQMRILLN
jgi:hypothetical protein